MIQRRIQAMSCSHVEQRITGKVRDTIVSFPEDNYINNAAKHTNLHIIANHIVNLAEKLYFTVRCTPFATLQI